MIPGGESSGVEKNFVDRRGKHVSDTFKDLANVSVRRVESSCFLLGSAKHYQG